jgi:hypothetical protein
MVHFLLIAAAFFAIHAWLAPPDRTGTQIVVSQSVVAGPHGHRLAVEAARGTKTLLAT